MPRALLLVAGVVLLAGGLFIAALQRVTEDPGAAQRPPDTALRDQLRAVSAESERLRIQVAELSREIERLRAGPPAPTHQRIHETLLPALAEGKEELAEPALLLLSGIDPLDRPCAKALLDALRSRQERVRILAAQALSMRRDRFHDLDRDEVADGLVDAAARDRVAEVRMAALESLEGCNPPDVDLDILLNVAASDTREEVRVRAARALVGARPAAKGPFLARIERIFETESSRQVRRELVIVAARAGGEAARPTLERLRGLAPDLSGDIDGAIAGLPHPPK